MDGISFIIPNRGGKDLDKVISNIKHVYSKINKEILIIEQVDERPFMRGELFNIGVKFSSFNYLALSDNDIWHLRELPLFELYDSLEQPIVCFTYISQLEYNNGNVKIIKTEKRPYGFGAFTFLSKEDFIDVNGFSNLYVGWGCEDIDFIERFNGKFTRLPQNLGHLQHPKRENKNPLNTALNREFYFDKKKHPRDILKDGIKQTTFNLVSEKFITDDVKWIKVNNISVCNDFAYDALLEKHFSYKK